MRERMLEPQKLSATGARKRFVLTDLDLRDTPHELRCNPYIRSAAPMRLYRVSDLRPLAETKHDGIAYLESKRAARAERGIAISNAMQSARGKRVAKLLGALHARGCELRSDSQLCARYLVTGRGNVEDIANTMAEMRFCFDHTRYTQIMNDNIQSMREAGERFNVHEESQCARCQAIMEFKRDGRDMHLLPAHLVDHV